MASKRCIICTAPARSHNYGALSCDACKSFFLRSNQGALYRSFRCLNGSDCTIDVDSRRNCSYCRFQRCLLAGMDISKSKTEQERSQQLAKRRTRSVSVAQDNLELAAQELFEELTTLANAYAPRLEDKSRFFTMMEMFDLDTLNGKYAYSFYNIPITDDLRKSEPHHRIQTSTDIISAVIQRLFFFANSVPQFLEVAPNDRKKLFKGSCSEICLINSSLAFKKDERLWLCPTNSYSQFYKGVPAIGGEEIVKVLGSRDLHEQMVNLTVHVQNLRPDETMIMLSFIVLLFNPSHPGVDAQNVRKSQVYYASLLRKYLLWRFGAAQGNNVFYALVSAIKEYRKIGRVVFGKIHGPILQDPKYNILASEQL